MLLYVSMIDYIVINIESIDIYKYAKISNFSETARVNLQGLRPEWGIY